MVVVPTDTHVELEYGRSTSDIVFYAITAPRASSPLSWPRVKGPMHCPPS